MGKSEYEKMNTRRRLVTLLSQGWRVNTFARLPEQNKARALGFEFLYHLWRDGEILALFV